MPTDLEYGSPRTKAYDDRSNHTSREDSLDQLEEARYVALLHLAWYQQSLRHYHARGVRSRDLQVGDLVLRLRQDARGRHKLTPPWEGPFVIAKVLKPRTYKLANSQGEVYGNAFGEVRPSLGRRRGPKISTPKDDVIATLGPSLPWSSPGIRPEQAARPVTPGPRPAVLQGRQPDPRPRLVNSGVDPANGRPGQASANQVFFSSQLSLCSC